MRISAYLEKRIIAHFDKLHLWVKGLILLINLLFCNFLLKLFIGVYDISVPSAVALAVICLISIVNYGIIISFIPAVEIHNLLGSSKLAIISRIKAYPRGVLFIFVAVLCVFVFLLGSVLASTEMFSEFLKSIASRHK